MGQPSDPYFDVEAQRAGLWAVQALPRRSRSKYVKTHVLKFLADTKLSVKAKKKAEAYLRVRTEVGKKKYGVYLQVDNGRDVLRDATEEVFDGLMYFTQLRYGSRSARVQLMAGKYAQTLFDMWIHLMENEDAYRAF